MSTQTGECACGKQVTREINESEYGGKYLEFVRRMPFVCAECSARAEAERADEEEAFRRDEEIRTQQLRLRQSQVPARFAGLTLDTLNVNAAVAAARRWVDDRDRQGLLLTGPVGVGKTHLAACALGSLVEKGRPIRWMSGPLMFARLGSGIGSDEHSQVMGILTGKVALVLDDLDKTRPTAFGAENVFLAVDGRVANNVPLIVTTNLSIAEIVNHWPEPYGEAIASRLAGYCQIVHMEGHDRRLAA